MTSHANPEIQGRFSEDILRFIEKPFDLKELAGTIIKGLDLSYEGDYLARISASNFLQIINMEQKTCLFEI